MIVWGSSTIWDIRNHACSVLVTSVCQPHGPCGSPHSPMCKGSGSATGEQFVFFFFLFLSSLYGHAFTRLHAPDLFGLLVSGAR